MTGITLRPFGPIHRYRSDLAAEGAQADHLVLSGTVDETGYTLHVDALAIRVATEHIAEDPDGPLAVVREQQVPIPGGVVTIEDRGDDEVLIEVLWIGREPLHICFESGRYDGSAEDFDAADAHVPAPAVARRGTNRR